MIFDLSNLPYWIFLGTGVLLFGLVIVAGGGEEGGDFDGDADVDADFELEADGLGLDADLDPDLPGGSSVSFGQVLAWFGVGRAPLLLLLGLDFSLWGLLGWMGNVAIAGWINQAPQGGIASLILLGSGAIALTLGGFIARPIGKIFASFGEDSSDDRVVGCLGTVNSASIPFQHSQKIGQVDVLDRAKNRVIISAVLPDWATITVRRGATVLVIERLASRYVVLASPSPDQDRWMSGSSRDPAISP